MNLSEYVLYIYIFFSQPIILFTSTTLFHWIFLFCIHPHGLQSVILVLDGLSSVVLTYPYDFNIFCFMFYKLFSVICYFHSCDFYCFFTKQYVPVSIFHLSRLQKPNLSRISPSKSKMFTFELLYYIKCSNFRTI